MGIPQSGERDLARGLVTGTFTATGESADLVAQGGLNITIAGTFVATVKPRRSFDGGTTWHYLTIQDGFTDRSFIAPASFWIYEFEDGVLYSLECTDFTSGTVSYRLSI